MSPKNRVKSQLNRIKHEIGKVTMEVRHLSLIGSGEDSCSSSGNSECKEADLDEEEKCAKIEEEENPLFCWLNEFDKQVIKVAKKLNKEGKVRYEEISEIVNGEQG